MRTIWPEKDPGESLIATFDFSPELEVGESIPSATCTVSAVIGTDDDAADMLYTDLSIYGGNVFQRFRGGLEGVTYNLRCAAMTSAGRILVLSAQLPVRVLL